MKKTITTLISIFTLFSTKVLAEEIKKPHLSTHEEQYFLKNIKQLTSEGEKSGEAYFSPDGKKILFQSVRDKSKFYQIYMMNSDGSNTKLISSGKGKTTCAYFSPDGKKIIYASNHLAPDSEKEPPKGKGYQWDFEKSLDIFKADLDGSHLERLTTSNAYDAEGTYSTDGKKIIFTSSRDNDDMELYVMDADGKNQKRITNHKGYDGGAFFSPDNKKIVYRRFDDKGNAQIILSDSDGKNIKELTNYPAINWCPSFHPDGKHIVFSSNMNERKNFELYIMDLDGKNLRQITHNKGSDILPVFSPDGKKLLWTSTRSDDKSQIFVADFNIDSFKDTNNYPASIYENLKYLSSDELEGRRSGTKGAEKACDFITQEFKKSGLVPYNGKDFIQKFNVITGVNLGKNNFLKLDKKDVSSNDFVPLSFSADEQITGELVFVGYGITSKENNYDDYAGIDVKDKIVVLLRQEPQKKETRDNKFIQFSDLRYKAFNAKKHGAKGIILINGFGGEDELRKLSNDETTSSGGIPFIHTKRSVIEKLFEKNDLSLKKVQEKINAEVKPFSFSLKTNADISVEIKREYKSTSNVIGIIKGNDEKLKDEVIIIGAHYDHLGYGGSESLSESKEPMIHNGADDNASGTTGLIELAKEISKSNPKRTIAFVAFSGEEIGLLGSSFFTNNTPFKNTVTMINMDMIGRLNESSLSVGGNKTSGDFEPLLNKLNTKYGFKLSFFDDGYGPSDHMSFYTKNVPVLFFFTGIHNDYHRPTDDYYKINFEGLKKVTDFVKDITLEIDNKSEKPNFVKIMPKANLSSDSDSNSGSTAYVGAIPDYTAMSENGTGGVKISAVKQGTPAEKANIKDGDIIVKFDDIVINNIYDYTFAIKSKKPNDKVKLVVKRNDKEVFLDLVLGKK